MRSSLSAGLVLSVFLIGVASYSVSPAAGKEPAEKPAAKAGQSIKVEVTGLLETGIVAIGGETTGIRITANNITWELDIKDKKLLAPAQELNGKTVVVKGELRAVKGVEIPLRWIVAVSDLKAGKN